MTGTPPTARLAPTPGQTVGPFFGYALPFPQDSALVPPAHPQAVRLHGRVLDGSGAPVPDAILELWQADPRGAVVQQEGSLHRDGWTFTGWGRAATDDTGRYTFSTLAPGAEPGKAPFFALTLFARGLLNRLFTRAYLPVDEAVLAADPLLSTLPAEERATLLTVPDPHGYLFDVRLQGAGETVFLRYPGHER
jgi:protocatechuate 3,4-dioxygenase alpha subunit